MNVEKAIFDKRRGVINYFPYILFVSYDVFNKSYGSAIIGNVWYNYEFDGRYCANKEIN